MRFVCLVCDRDVSQEQAGWESKWSAASLVLTAGCTADGGTGGGSTAMVAPAASPGVVTQGLAGTGIPGMSGNPDMRFTGVVRMRGMPYRSSPHAWECTWTTCSSPIVEGRQVKRDYKLPCWSCGLAQLSSSCRVVLVLRHQLVSCDEQVAFRLSCWVLVSMKHVAHRAPGSSAAAQMLISLLSSRA